MRRAASLILCSVLSFLAAGAPRLCAQSHRAPVDTIRGVVTDSSTGHGIPGVQVFIASTVYSALTDSHGQFRCPIPSVGRQTLRAHAIGYLPRAVVLRPTDHRHAVRLSMQLDPNPRNDEKGWVTVSPKPPQ